MENGYPQPGQATVPGGTSLPQSGHLMSESILKPHCGQACALSLTFVLHSGHRINILPPPPTLLCPTRVLGSLQADGTFNLYLLSSFHGTESTPRPPAPSPHS